MEDVVSVSLIIAGGSHKQNASRLNSLHSNLHVVIMVVTITLIEMLNG